MLKLKYYYLLLFSAIACNTIFAGTVADLTYTEYTVKHYIDTPDREGYRFNNDHDIGYISPEQDYHEYWRTVYKVSLSALPSGSYISNLTVNAEVIEDEGIEGPIAHIALGSNSINLSNASSVFNNGSQSWTLLQSFAYDLTPSFDISSHITAQHIQDGFFTLIAYATPDNINSIAKISISIDLEYSSITLTAKNSFVGGTIKVGMGTEPVEETSPFQVVVQGSQTLNLQAQDQDYNNINRTWNTNGVTGSISWWKREVGTSITPKSQNQSYSFTPTIDDNGVNYVAYLMKNYAIVRNDDCTEFDNLILGAETNYIVEQNSGQYSAPSTKTVNNRTYNFVEWTDDPTAPRTRTITPTDNVTKTAFFKYPHHSNDNTTFSSNNQNKFVKSPNGHLHVVYESMGKIWYEVSTDNGSTWTIKNDGKPLSNITSKNPSIECSSNYYSFIAFQENHSGYSLIKVVKVNYINGSIVDTELFSNSLPDQYSYDANPVVRVSREDAFYPIIMVVYSKYISNGFLPVNGLVMSVGKFNASSDDLGFNSSLYPYQVEMPNTDLNSKNPTITNDVNSNTFHVAWQQGSGTIKYQRVVWDEQNDVLNSYDFAEPSSGVSGFSNFQPSITMYGDYPVIVWVRQNNYTYVKECALRIRFSASSWSQFYSYSYGGGDDIDIVNINEGGNYDFILAWGGYGNNDQYLKSNSTTIVYNLTSSGDVQVSNGSGFSGMRIKSFDKYNSPYGFDISGTDGLLKSNSNNSNFVTRKIDLINEDLNAQVGISSVTVDGNRIHFVGEDSFLDEGEDFESSLLTKPFILTDNSIFTFSFNHNVSNLNSSALSTTNSVKVKATLIDAQTNETIGLLNEIVIDGSRQVTSGVNNFLVNTAGIGEREVKLVLKVKDNLKKISKYAVTTNVVSNGAELEKNSYEEIMFTGDSPVTEYALAQNYPNPFNPTTTIKYQIPNSGNVSLKIYDVLGAEVMTLVNTTQAQGKYEVKFDASQLSSGVYIYRIQANDYVASRKMMLLK